MQINILTHHLIQKYCTTHILSVAFHQYREKGKTFFIPYQEEIKARTKWYKKPPGRASQSQQKWKHFFRDLVSLCIPWITRPDESGLSQNETGIIIIINIPIRSDGGEWKILFDWLRIRCFVNMFTHFNSFFFLCECVFVEPNHEEVFVILGT